MQCQNAKLFFIKNKKDSFFFRIYGIRFLCISFFAL
jgi:hypothetical protein